MGSHAGGRGLRAGGSSTDGCVVPKHIKTPRLRVFYLVSGTGPDLDPEF